RRELPRAAGLRIHDPELAHACPGRGEYEMPRVGRPRRLLVYPFAGQRLGSAAASTNRLDLISTAEELLIGDQTAVRGPIGVGPIVVLVEIVIGEHANARAVGVNNI